MDKKHLFLILPFPPSVNGLFAGKSRRYLSPRYKEWRERAYHAVLQQVKDRIEGCAIITYGFQRPDNRARDVQNYTKAIADFLVAHDFIQDDSLVLAEYPYWLDEAGSGVMINIYGIGDPSIPQQIANLIHAHLTQS